MARASVYRRWRMLSVGNKYAPSIPTLGACFQYTLSPPARVWRRHHSIRASCVSKPFSTAAPFVIPATPGLFGVTGLRHPEDFLRLARESVSRCENLKHGLLTGRVPAGVDVIRDMDAISNTLCIAIDAAELARNVHSEEAWREAAEEAFAGLSGYIHELNTDVGLYQAVCSVVKDPHVAATLDEEGSRTAQLLKAEFESSGIHLPDLERQEVRALLNEITSLETMFSNNLILGRRSFQVSKSDILAQIPSEIVQNVILPHQPPGQPPHLLTLTTDTAVANAVLRYARDGNLRRRMYQEVNTSPRENLEVLSRLIKSRDTLARKLGFPSYAHRFLADKMAKCPEEVDRFLRALAENVRAKAGKELEVLQRAKQEDEGGWGDSADFHSWDLSYYMGAVKSARHGASTDGKGVSAYLSLENCLRGLALLSQRLFGIELREVALDETEAWAPAESKLKKVVLLHPRHGQLGTIYLDLYPRQAKYTHHAQFTVRCGCLPAGASSYQLPVVALVCNFSPCDPAGPVLLTHAELEALFHEFGHALHSLLSRTRFQHVAGTRAPVDFVETPSHLLEYFVWDQRVLAQFAHHHQTGRPIPAELTAALRAAKREFSGLDTQIQVLYSLVDQKLFGPQPLAEDPTTSAFLASVQEKVMQMPHSEGAVWHARFGHLTGYGAGYYGYLYDRVFASHLWERLFVQDPWSREAGERLWKEMLVHGGGKDPCHILRDVLGEEPALDSFLAELEDEGEIEHRA
ncbi:mitochondrial intermediate peptidase [Nannochloropsis gaditana]|uniref:Mitochondrial intermediate peptidase n=2 Tax=Nannochloropsis gaditana TaxID=72520 RepID=W7TEG5_9STRA|nr:mitochondrial intermediate peptidase [Nannochloropsis gaditana]